MFYAYAAHSAMITKRKLRFYRNPTNRASISRFNAYWMKLIMEGHA